MMFQVALKYNAACSSQLALARDEVRPSEYTTLALCQQLRFNIAMQSSAVATFTTGTEEMTEAMIHAFHCTLVKADLRETEV